MLKDEYRVSVPNFSLTLKCFRKANLQSLYVVKLMQALLFFNE